MLVLRHPPEGLHVSRRSVTPCLLSVAYSPVVVNLTDATTVDRFDVHDFTP